MRRSLLAILIITMAPGASAHNDGSLHSHPHLLINNEILAAMLLLAAAGLFIGARRILAKVRNPRKDSPRKHRVAK